MSFWIARIGALAVALAVAVAPSARAACIARCVAAHPPAAASSDRTARAAAPDDTAAASQHAHHQPQGVATARSARSTPPAIATALREAQCAPDSARGCGDVRSTLATPGSRAEPHAVALVALASTPGVVPALVIVRPARSTSSIRPPGVGPAPLPLRI